MALGRTTGRKYKIMGVAMAIESVYGQDAVPTLSQAIETVEPTITVNSTEVEHDVTTGKLGNTLSRMVGQHLEVKFKVAMAGSGTAGTAPPYDVCLRACSMAGVLDSTTTRYRYNFVDVDAESSTIYFFADGARHRITGARGTWTIAFSKLSIPYFEFTFTGLYVGSVDALEMPALELAATWQVPEAFSDEQTTLSLHGLSPVMVSGSVDAGVENVYRNLPGQEAVIHKDRNVSGQLHIDAPDLDVKDYFASVDNSETGAYELVHGKAAGNIVRLEGPKVQLSSINYANDEDILGYSFNARFIPEAAGSDLFLEVY